MVRYFKPRRIIEIGGGFSTRVMAQACVRNGDGELVTVDPHPDPILVSGFPGLSRCIQAQVQDLEVSMFQALQEGDMLFIDSSHVVRCSGDVNHLYLKVLPTLRKGVIVHAHDMFFPYEYPKPWGLKQFRFYSEQYLVQGFLMFNSEFEVLLCNSYLGKKHIEELRATFPLSPWYFGGSLWMS
jgi:predicted O-methyltransferase YrrM